VDSTAQTTPVDLEMVTKNSVAADSEIIDEIVKENSVATETVSTGYALIHQRTQLMLT
jgi:hypothetical protein